MVCRNFEFRLVLPIFNCKVLMEHVQYLLYDCYVCIYASINLLCISNLKINLLFLLVFNVFTLSTFGLELLIYKIFCLKTNSLLDCIESVNYIYQQIPYTFMWTAFSVFSMFYTLCTFCIFFYFSLEI